MKYPKKHPLTWFKKGLTIVKDKALNLFSEPITIASDAHGKALHASQDKGIRYVKI